MGDMFRIAYPMIIGLLNTKCIAKLSPRSLATLQPLLERSLRYPVHAVHRCT